MQIMKQGIAFYSSLYFFVSALFARFYVYIFADTGLNIGDEAPNFSIDNPEGISTETFRL